MVDCANSGVSSVAGGLTCVRQGLGTGALHLQPVLNLWSAGVAKSAASFYCHDSVTNRCIVRTRHSAPGAGDPLLWPIGDRRRADVGVSHHSGADSRGADLVVCAYV